MFPPLLAGVTGADLIVIIFRVPVRHFILNRDAAFNSGNAVTGAVCGWVGHLAAIAAVLIRLPLRFLRRVFEWRYTAVIAFSVDTDTQTIAAIRSIWLAQRAT